MMRYKVQDVYTHEGIFTDMKSAQPVQFTSIFGDIDTKEIDWAFLERGGMRTLTKTFNREVVDDDIPLERRIFIADVIWSLFGKRWETINKSLAIDYDPYNFKSTTKETSNTNSDTTGSAVTSEWGFDAADPANREKTENTNTVTGGGTKTVEKTSLRNTTFSKILSDTMYVSKINIISIAIDDVLDYISLKVYTVD